MRPSKISDVIAAMALFRPATMDSGATDAYLSRRNGTSQIPERHPLIAKHTADTYGVLIYQEQALDILKDLGLSVEEIEKARKAIKASNANVGNAAKALDDLMEHITTLAREQGFEQGDLDFLTNALHAYAGYSFNRAHATAYGILAYQTAFLAEHHPLAFWTGTLVANEDAPVGPRGIKPEDKYLRAAKEDGIRVRPPHVNRSDVTYCTDGDFVYKGLKSIKGVGNVAAQELVTHQPYQSLDDLARRVSPRRVTGAKDLGKGHTPDACPGTVKALYEATALYGLTRETE
jgi:DNA polymerase-3 subunit alpha